MTDKEFRRLNRAELIEIIYQLQVKVDELTAQNQVLEDALADKRLRIESTGNLAEAALEINDCFCSAQRAAEQYLNEVRTLCDQAEAQRQEMLAQARKEAAAIITVARRRFGRYDDAEVEAILAECEQKRAGNR